MERIWKYKLMLRSGEPQVMAMPGGAMLLSVALVKETGPTKNITSLYVYAKVNDEKPPRDKGVQLFETDEQIMGKRLGPFLGTVQHLGKVYHAYEVYN